MIKTMTDNYKETYNTVSKQRRIKKESIISPIIILDKFFNRHIAKRQLKEHGIVIVTFKDKSMCIIATNYRSIKAL